MLVAVLPTAYTVFDDNGQADTETLGTDNDLKSYDFNDQSIRKAFIRKVYSILMCQLSISIVFIAWFLYDEKTQKIIQENPVIWVFCLLVLIVTLIGILCFDKLRRTVPMNYIFLGVFTVAKSVLLAVSASRYDTDTVLIAVALTAVTCLALTLFAFQTRWDFTMMGGVLVVACVILPLFGLIACILEDSAVTILYGSLGAFIFSIYLVYDTQLMMGGKHKYTISPEEYIFAALNLYLDVVNIFKYILIIFRKH